MALLLFFALYGTVSNAQTYQIRLARCSSVNQVITYNRDYSDQILVNLINASTSVAIMHSADGRNVTAYAPSYPLDQLAQGGVPSFPLGGGFATPALIASTWQGPSDLLDTLWNNCGGGVDLSTYAYWACGNDEGLNFGVSACSWNRSNPVDTVIEMYVTVPNFNACFVNSCPVNNSKCVPDGPAPITTATCACKAGFTGSGNTSCTDIDACSTKPCSDPLYPNCLDYPAPALAGVLGRICCAPGYEGLLAPIANDSTCVDINACDNHPCGANQTCTDVPAPAIDTTSGRTCACAPGFTNTSGVCKDVNACTTSPCPVGGSTCADYPPPAGSGTAGRLCCTPGYYLNISAFLCQDINACTWFPCMADATCGDVSAPALNSSSGRDCNCNTGFQLNGGTCDDINACINHACPVAGSVCQDYLAPALDDDSGRLCCLPGQSLVGLTCIEINACTNNGCDPNAVCTDLNAPALDDPTGRTCTCNNGYEPVGTTCEDINACTNHGCMTNAECQDLPPPALDTDTGRTCSCNTGYQMNGTNCDDINACTAHPCINATCSDLPAPALNTAGDRSCTCNTGYEMQGGNCVDMDACTGVSVCGPNAHCQDLPPPNLKDASGRTCSCLGTYTKDNSSTCTVCNASKDSLITNSSCCNGVSDDQESGTDCGGADCQPCALGVTCVANTDCQTGNICDNKICAEIKTTTSPTTSPTTTPPPGSSPGGLKSSDIIIIVVVIVAVLVCCFCLVMFYPRKNKDGDQPAVKKRAVRVKSPLRDSTIMGSTPLRSSIVEMNNGNPKSDMPDLEDESRRGDAAQVPGHPDDDLPRPSGGADGVKLLTPPQSSTNSNDRPEEKIRDVSAEEISRLRAYLADSQMMTTEQAEGIPVDVLTDLISEGHNLEETFAVCKELYAQGVRLEKMRPAGEPSNPKRVKTTYTRTYRVVRQKSAHLEEEQRPSSSSGAKRQIKKPPPLSPTLGSPSVQDHSAFSIDEE